MDTEYVIGLDAVDAFLEQFGQKAVEEAANLLYERGEMIMTDSKQNYVPVDQGVLQGSGHVQPPEIRGTEVSVTLGYGGPAEAYAVVQHENLQFRHPKQGQAKYLERPFLAGIKGLGEWIAAGLKSRLGT